ncbi:MAG: hypothetical protein JXQ99_06210 [Hyphomicrobiaceae bacterium]
MAPAMTMTVTAAETAPPVTVTMEVPAAPTAAPAAVTMATTPAAVVSVRFLNKFVLADDASNVRNSSGLAG